MPCYHPLQASFSNLEDGKKYLRFNSVASNAAARCFTEGSDFSGLSSVLSLPCGRCMGCRLERSRQWALRCMHEASLYEDNCFVTLTYSDDFLPVDGSLNKVDFQLFMKRLRSFFTADRIRYFMCGEYGEDLCRPHYHICIFGFDFPDKLFYKKCGDHKLYTSQTLEKLWGKGFCPIGSLTFDSAAYVARYCTKKVTGDEAASHYAGRQPEFALMSRRPGIGYSWYEKWKGDCYPSDYLVVNGTKCKPPRYYDKRLEKENPALFQDLKLSRLEFAKEDEDTSHSRLLVREKCQMARFKKLIRVIERSSV